jgi:serine/threonine-protein kinase ATR
LQRPKKVTIIGNDGKSYIFLCKPEDDLRKDSRLMEFNSIVNKLLKKDSDARKRKLGNKRSYLAIRTYAVVPLNETCGLIEWVEKMHAYRNIVTKIYKEKNIFTAVIYF